jgi:ribonuclease HII
MAASILAKVARDEMMVEYDRVHPGYRFSSHKGYPTREHLAALRLLGPCPIHRKTFRGVVP